MSPAALVAAASDVAWYSPLQNPAATLASEGRNAAMWITLPQLSRE